MIENRGLRIRWTFTFGLASWMNFESDNLKPLIDLVRLPSAEKKITSKLRALRFSQSFFSVLKSDEPCSTFLCCLRRTNFLKYNLSWRGFHQITCNHVCHGDFLITLAQLQPCNVDSACLKTYDYICACAFVNSIVYTFLSIHATKRKPGLGKH